MLAFLLDITDPKEKRLAKRLYKKYGKQLRKYITYVMNRDYFVRDSFRASEIVEQNVFERIVKHIDKIKLIKDERHLKNYIFRISKNEIANYLIDTLYCVSYDLISESIGEEDEFFAELEKRDLYERLLKAISELDGKYSSVLGLYYSEELSVAEISELLGIPQKTVYTRLRRGIEILKRKFGIGENE